MEELGYYLGLFDFRLYFFIVIMLYCFLGFVLMEFMVNKIEFVDNYINK